MNTKNTPRKTYQQNYEDFWKSIVENPDGTLDRDKVMRELSDYSELISNATRVYCHVTGDRISKANTRAEDIIQVSDDIRQEEIDEATKGGIEEVSVLGDA